MSINTTAFEDGEEIIDAELLPPDHPGPHLDKEPEPKHRATSTLGPRIRGNLSAVRDGARHLAAEYTAWRTLTRIPDAAIGVLLLNEQHTVWKTRRDRDTKAANEGLKRLAASPEAPTQKGQKARDLWEARLDKVTHREFEHVDPGKGAIAARRAALAKSRTIKARSTLATLAAIDVTTFLISPTTSTVATMLAAGAAGTAAWLQGRRDHHTRYAHTPALPELAFAPNRLPAAVAELEADAAAKDAGFASAADYVTHLDAEHQAQQAAQAATQAAAETAAQAAAALDDCPEAEQLNEVLRAVGILPKGNNAPGVTVITAPDYTVGNGYRMTVDLPKGDGILVRQVLKDLDKVAGEYGVSKMRIIAREIPPSEGGHGRRMSWWVCEHDPYTHGEPTRSPYATAPTADYWSGVHLGALATRERRQMPTQVPGGLTSVFVSGQQRFGKSTLLRLAAAAGVLDPGVRIYAYNGKKGRDWRPLARVAHRLVEGTSPEEIAQLFAMLDELIGKMNQRYADFANLPLHLIPDGRLTPELAREHGMPILALLLDELQFLVKAMTPEQRKELFDKLGQLLLGGPAAGIVLWTGTQRADHTEIPVGWRDLHAVRASVRMPDSRSSKMALGDVAADAGADSSILGMEHVAVVLLALGPDWQILRMDRLTDADWAEVCERGRKIRQNHGTLSGDAAGEVIHVETPAVRALRAVIAVMDAAGEDRGRLADLADTLAGNNPVEWGGLTGNDLGQLLRAAGAGQTSGLGPWRGQANPNGYKRDGLAAALNATTRKTA